MLAPEGAGGGEPTPAAPAPTTTPAAGKVFTEEYVQTLREEAKNHRLAKKAAETLLRKVIGLKDDDEIDEVKITAFQSNQQKAISDAMAAANNRIIEAEIKGMADHYDIKLLGRLIDRSKITVDDKGDVKGITEQLDALALEFPAIKKAGAPPAATPPPAPAAGGFNPSNTPPATAIQQVEEAIKAAQAQGNTKLVVALRNKLFDLQKSKG
jgi:hypothetical protein